MTTWREDKNSRALARLQRATPPAFPPIVLDYAMACRLVPPLPSLALAGYWRSHVLEADELARSLAARNAQPDGWAWRVGGRDDGLPQSFRAPPAPFREAAFRKGPGSCCICGQPVFRFGWHEDVWDDGHSNRRANWHGCCVAAWKFWNAPADHAVVLRRLQAHRCRVTGRRLLRSAEVDHRTPLFQVWREHRTRPWPALLAFWGAPNLQVINRVVHREKCATEAGERASSRVLA